jgi:hypothetical protein
VARKARLGGAPIIPPAAGASSVEAFAFTSG